MKLRIIAVVALLASLIAFLPRANAFDWSGTAINSGYAVTTDFHGIDVPMGVDVTARAGTTNLDIVEVKFRWLEPDGTEFTIVSVTTFTIDSFDGQTVHVFLDTQTPNVVGDWGVQGVFYDGDGHGHGPIAEQTEPVAIRAQSFFVVPETALGVIAVMAAMFGSLGIFALRKKRVF